jgi:hypothetical protein
MENMYKNDVVASKNLNNKLVNYYQIYSGKSRMFKMLIIIYINSAKPKRYSFW